jgi:hypothetical protein
MLVEEFTFQPAPFECHIERVKNQRRSHIRTCCISDDAAAERVENDGKERESGIRWDT